MRKYILTALTASLCLNFTICASAEDAVETAVETAVPATEISLADDFSYAEEGGLVPTHIDDTIELPELTLAEEINIVYLPETEAFGADEIVPATREDGTPIARYMTMSDLYQAWYASGKYEYNYPDYVCGVWTETGDMSELVVAVTKDEAGEAGKEEILSLIENDDSVKFTYQSYSYKELRQVQDEITSCMGAESGIYALGVYEMDNKVHADIDMSNPNAEATVEKLLLQYGDMLVFEAGNGIVLDTAAEGFVDSAGGYDMGYTEEAGVCVSAVAGEETAVTTEISIAAEKHDGTRLFAVCAAVFVFGLAGAVTVNRKRARQTAAGVVTEGGKLTASDTETIIRKTAEEPARDIFRAVMEEIDK